MTPCDLNILIAAISNQLYCRLTREEFKCLSVFLNELSKSMLSTLLFEDVCKPPEHKKPSVSKKPTLKEPPKEDRQGGNRDGHKKGLKRTADF